MDKIKTAIIGYGRTAQNLHAAGLRSNSESFQVNAVAGVTPGNLEQAKADFNCETYTNYQAMLQEQDLDLAIVTTRNHQHCSMAIDALNSGAHVLVTKPIGINQIEVERIYDAAEKAGRKVFPYLPARWGSDFRRIQEIVNSGEIGKVFSIRRSVYGFATRDDWQTETQSGGGIILNWGAHLIDPPMQIAGGNPKQLYGSCRRLLNSGDAEDCFYSIIEMDNGIRVHAEWSFAPKGLANWFVQGTRGAIIVNGTQLEVHAGEPSKPSDPTCFKNMEGNGYNSREETLSDAIYGDPVEIYRSVAQDLFHRIPFPIVKNDVVQLTRAMDAIKVAQNSSQLIQLS
ncbi:MAG: Gfo/Idh/MocA family oxidoreductase [Verrucomicrobiota bacterium]